MDAGIDGNVDASAELHWVSNRALSKREDDGGWEHWIRPKDKRSHDVLSTEHLLGNPLGGHGVSGMRSSACRARSWEACSKAAAGDRRNPIAESGRRLRNFGSASSLFSTGWRSAS